MSVLGYVGRTLCLALLGGLSQAIVPSPTIMPDGPYKSIKWARVAYSIGAILVVFGIGASISIDFRNAKNLEQPDIDSPAKIK